MDDHLAFSWTEGIRSLDPGSPVSSDGYGYVRGYNDIGMRPSRSLQSQINRDTSTISDGVQMIICLSMYGAFL